MPDAHVDLAFIDWTILAVYMVGTLVLGTFFGKYVKDAGDFFVASKALPFWAIGMSVVVSDIGAMDFIAVAGETYNSGIAVANFDWMGSMPAMVFAAFIFIPYYWRSGVYTIPEFLGRRYNGAVQIIHGGIWGIFLLMTLSLMLWVTADEFMNTLFGINPYIAVWLVVLFAGFYTFSGGLSAVVMTDAVQMIVMFVGGIALLILSLWHVGGPSAMYEAVTNQPTRIVAVYTTEDVEAAAPAVDAATLQAALEERGVDIISARDITQDIAEGVAAESRIVLEAGGDGSFVIGDNEESSDLIAEAVASVKPDGATAEQNMVNYKNHFSILLPNDTQTAFPWSGIVFGLGIVLATAYMSGNQGVVQRTLGARSEWDAKGGMLFAGFLKSFIPLMVAVPGLCAILIVPELADYGEGDRAVPMLIKQILPPGLRGLMFAALMAALMSSVDSSLNSSTTIWTTDIYGRLRRFFTGESITEKHALIVGRTLTVIFIFLAGAAAPVFQYVDGIYNFIQSAMSLFQGPVLAILLLGIMWRRTTQWGGLAGLLLGMCCTFILDNIDGLFPSNDPYLFVAWWSFVFSMIITIVVSLLTPPEPDEKIRGLVFGQVMHDGEVQRVLGERVK